MQTVGLAQEPRKGGFSKGGFCRVQCHDGGNKNKNPRILAPAVHLTLRASEPREAYILQKPPSKKTPFSWFLIGKPYPKDPVILKILRSY